MAESRVLVGITRSGKPLAEGLDQGTYDGMMKTWLDRFPSGLSGSEMEERFRGGGINAALRNTTTTPDRS